MLDRSAYPATPAPPKTRISRSAAATTTSQELRGRATWLRPVVAAGPGASTLATPYRRHRTWRANVGARRSGGIPTRLIWRTGWDLNPRQPCGCTAFPVLRLRPDSATRPARESLVATLQGTLKTL